MQPGAQTTRRGMPFPCASLSGSLWRMEAALFGFDRIWRHKGNCPEGTREGPLGGCTANPQKSLRSRGFPPWLPGRAVGARAPGNPRKSGASHFFDSLRRGMPFPLRFLFPDKAAAFLWKRPRLSALPSVCKIPSCVFSVSRLYGISPLRGARPLCQCKKQTPVRGRWHRQPPPGRGLIRAAAWSSSGGIPQRVCPFFGASAAELLPFRSVASISAAWVPV